MLFLFSHKTLAQESFGPLFDIDGVLYLKCPSLTFLPEMFFQIWDDMIPAKKMSCQNVLLTFPWSYENVIS